MTNVPLSRKGRSKGCPGREPAPKTQCLKDNGNPNQLIKDVIALGGVFYYGFFFFSHSWLELTSVPHLPHGNFIY